MVEPSPLLSAGRPAGPAIYRPLSVVALLSFIVAALYALAVLVLGTVAFFTRSPLLGVWALVFPVVAAALALLARVSIARSEGTLSGAALARWGLWLSVVSGLLYLAYYVGAYLAVSRQAADFTTAWLQKIHEGKLNAAFLDTLDPARRRGENPDDPVAMRIRYEVLGDEGRKGPLVRFRESELVRVVQQSGPDLKIDYRGIWQWEYKEGGYEVRQTFQLTTPEGVCEVHIPVRSREGADLPGRQWAVAWQEHAPEFSSVTSLGKTLQLWRLDSIGFVHKWLKLRDEAQLKFLYLDTKDPSQRDRLSREFSPKMPDFEQFLRGSLITSQGFQASQDGLRDEIPRAVRALFVQPSAVMIIPGQKPADTRPVALGGDRVQMLQNIVLQVTPPGSPEGKPRFRVEAVIVMESDGVPVVPEQQPGWRVAWVELLQGGISSGKPEMPEGGTAP